MNININVDLDLDLELESDTEDIGYHRDFPYGEERRL